MSFEHSVIFHYPSEENRFPMLFPLANDELLLMFHSAPLRPERRHMDIAMRARLIHSHDGGRSWSPPVEFITADGQVSPTHSPSASKGSRLIIPYFHWIVLPRSERSLLERRLGTSHPPAFREDAYFDWVGAVEGVFVTSSPDGGRSWSPRRKIHVAPFLWGGTRDGVAQGAGGTLYLPLYGQRPGDRADVAFTVASEDGGETWGPPIITAEDPQQRIHYQEPAFLSLPSGKLIALYRTAGAGDLMVHNASDDGGKIWSEPRPTGLEGHPPHLLRLQSGAILCAYGYRHKPYGIRAALSRDEGDTWDTDHLLILRDDAVCSDPDMAPTDIGYPFSTQLADGTILTVYYFDKGKGERFIAGTFYRESDFDI